MASLEDVIHRQISGFLGHRSNMRDLQMRVAFRMSLPPLPERYAHWVVQCYDYQQDRFEVPQLHQPADPRAFAEAVAAGIAALTKEPAEQMTSRKKPDQEGGQRASSSSSPEATAEKNILPSKTSALMAESDTTASSGADGGVGAIRKKKKFDYGRLFSSRESQQKKRARSSDARQAKGDTERPRGDTEIKADNGKAVDNPEKVSSSGGFRKGFLLPQTPTCGSRTDSDGLKNRDHGSARCSLTPASASRDAGRASTSTADMFHTPMSSCSCDDGDDEQQGPTKRLRQDNGSCATSFSSSNGGASDADDVVKSSAYDCHTPHDIKDKPEGSSERQQQQQQQQPTNVFNFNSIHVAHAPGITAGPLAHHFCPGDRNMNNLFSPYGTCGAGAIPWQWLRPPQSVFVLYQCPQLLPQGLYPRVEDMTEIISLKCLETLARFLGARVTTDLVPLHRENEARAAANNAVPEEQRQNVQPLPVVHLGMEVALFTVQKPKKILSIHRCSQQLMKGSDETLNILSHWLKMIEATVTINTEPFGTPPNREQQAAAAGGGGAARGQ
ncbi:unnamed protein product [Amoebophrya sp. A25]|nr:unnamed protein product [Amoebophrya sp. A25]|eukprot:GSA25T00023176001.1